MSTLPRRPIYAGRVVNLGLETAALPDGRQVELEVIRHPGAAAVVPVHEDGQVTLIRQWRHAGGGLHVEVPAGLLEANESPENCARRELDEETQLTAGRLDALGPIYTTPGFTDERIHLFLARDLQPGTGRPDGDEYIRPFRVPLPEALVMTTDGRITDGKTICALHLAHAFLQRSSG